MIDWHNYTSMYTEKKRRGNLDECKFARLLPNSEAKHLSFDCFFVGKGEQGVKASLSSNYDSNKKTALYNTNGFNALLSDEIALNRSVKDIRHKG